MKRLLAVSCALIALLVLPGCDTSRTPLSIAEFKSKAEAAGYTVENGNVHLSSDKFGSSVIARKGADYFIEFGVASTEELAKSFYNEKHPIYESGSSSDSRASVNIGNYSFFYVTVGGRFIEASRVENTLIYVDVPVAFKDEVKQFLKDIGY